MFKAIPGISKKILVVSIAALFLVSMVFFVSPGKIYGATTWTVGPGETYTTIQAAIDAASAGDTITVKAGTYNEAITINKAITLLGAQAGVDARTRTGSESVIDPDAPDGGASKSWVIKVKSSNVTIDGFTVQNPTLNYGSAGLLYAEATESSYYENLFFRNNILQNPGIRTSQSTDWGKFGYDIGYCKNVLIEYNYIKNILCDKATPWNGTAAIWPWNTDGLTVRYNKIENVTTFGVGLSNSNTNAHIYNNDISLGNPGSEAVPSVSNAGIRVGPSGNENVVIEKNNISNCPGTDAQPGAGIRMQSAGPIDVKENKITGCPIGIRITADAVDISKINVNNNSLWGNLHFGLSVADGLSGGPLNATNNWWGDASGPSNATSNPSGTGDAVSDNVTYRPFYTNPELTILSTTTVSSGDIAGLISNGIFLADSPIDAPKITVTQQATINVPFGSGTSSVSLPAGTEITNVVGGNINPSALATAGVTPSSLSGLGTGIVVDGAFQWGIAGLGLQFSQPITITIYVGTALASQTLTILRSISETSDWTSDGIVPPATAVVDAAGYVTFQATKSSYYAATHTAAAVVEPQPSAPSKPLTPEEQASLNLSIAEQVDLYGASNIGFTKMLYDNILGRVSDDGGLNDWVTALNNGTITLGSVVYNFVFSKEFEPVISPASPEDFITFLYVHVLDRNADPDGYASWVSAMKNGMSKEEVLLHFLNSDEFKNICTMFGLTQ